MQIHSAWPRGMVAVHDNQSGWSMKRRAVMLGMVLAALTVSACSGASRFNESWKDADGNEVSSMLIWSVQGPRDHCHWGSATFLFLGREGELPGIDPKFYDQYVRDPKALFVGLSGKYLSEVELPDTAQDTGFSNGVARIWIDPVIYTWLYVEVDGRFERWPRVLGDSPLLCA